jgi:hypothetical protein
MDLEIEDLEQAKNDATGATVPGTAGEEEWEDEEDAPVDVGVD